MENNDKDIDLTEIPIKPTNLGQTRERIVENDHDDCVNKKVSKKNMILEQWEQEAKQLELRQDLK